MLSLTLVLKVHAGRTHLVVRRQSVANQTPKESVAPCLQRNCAGTAELRRSAIQARTLISTRHGTIFANCAFCHRGAASSRRSKTWLSRVAPQRKNPRARAPYLIESRLHAAASALPTEMQDPRSTHRTPSLTKPLALSCAIDPSARCARGRVVLQPRPPTGRSGMACVACARHRSVQGTQGTPLARVRDARRR